MYGLLTVRQNDSGGSAPERRARAEASDARLYEAGASLALALLGPIDNLDGFERLVIVADGILGYIPFSVLPHPRAAQGRGDYRPLVLSHEIVRVPSLSVVAAMRGRSGPGGGRGREGERPTGTRVEVFADPVFTSDDARVRGPGRAAPGQPGANELSLSTSLRGMGQTLATLPRLLASRGEAASIAKAASGADATITTDFRATRAAAEEALLEPHRVVHFATHGILNDEHPALSGVVLSLVDEEGRPQDGFLRTQDIYGLRVSAEIVVLSACETALGKMLRGEGITGLVHAFLHAGAHTVVASKWRVEDVATQELMAGFYRRMLAEGARPAAALRAAQIELLRRQRTRAPFFWGAFEVHGLS